MTLCRVPNESNFRILYIGRYINLSYPFDKHSQGQLCRHVKNLDQHCLTCLELLLCPPTEWRRECFQSCLSVIVCPPLYRDPALPPLPIEGPGPIPDTFKVVQLGLHCTWSQPSPLNSWHSTEIPSC